MAHTKKRSPILTNIALLLITVCILLVIVFQAQNVVTVLSPEPTATPIQAYTENDTSGIPVEMEDVLPTFTPAPTP